MVLRRNHRRQNGECLAADVIGDGGEEQRPDDPPPHAARGVGFRDHGCLLGRRRQGWMGLIGSRSYDYAARGGNRGPHSLQYPVHRRRHGWSKNEALFPGRVPHVRQSVHPDFLSRSLALTNFMRLSLMKAAHAPVGGAPCKKSGTMGRKRISFVVTRPDEWAIVQQEMISDQMAVGVAVHAT